MSDARETSAVSATRPSTPPPDHALTRLEKMLADACTYPAPLWQAVNATVRAKVHQLSGATPPSMRPFERREIEPMFKREVKR